MDKRLREMDSDIADLAGKLQANVDKAEAFKKELEEASVIVERQSLRLASLKQERIELRQRELAADTCVPPAVAAHALLDQARNLFTGPAGVSAAAHSLAPIA